MRLSKPQELIYNMEKYAGGSIGVICGSVLFDGGHTVGELHAAVRELFRLNEALRIRISEENGTASQYVRGYAGEEAEEVLSFNSREELDRYAEEYAREPLALSGCLCRIKIVCLPDKKGLLCKMHHLICDAWTVCLVGTQMNGLLRGVRPSPGRFSAYIESEDKYLQSPRRQKDRQYFAELYSRSGGAVLLKEQKPGAFVSRRRTFVLSEDGRKLLYESAEKAGVSPAAYVLTALAVYISRRKMNPGGFFIGTGVLNRNNAEELSAMGTFVNTVPVFVAPEENVSFAKNAQKTQESLFSVFRHQRYHYGDLLADLRTGADFRGALYDVLFNWQNAQVTGGGVETAWYPCGMQTQSLQLHIDDRDREGILKINYDFRADCFSENEIEQLHSRLFGIISDAAHTADDVKTCELGRESEAPGGLSVLRGEDVPIRPGATLWSLFEEYAKKNGEKVCITDESGDITFGQFLRLCERLDGAIRRKTDGKKQPIGIRLERSAEMYLAVYAVIRGGSAYMPIDIAQPPKRTGFMLRNSGARLILGRGNAGEDTFGADYIDVSRYLTDDVGNDPVPPPAALETDTAYIIYTSGTTGHPKGAMIPHRCAVNRINWMQRAYPVNGDSVILQKTPYTFDVSVWELFWWGLFGGKLAYSKPEEHFLPEKLVCEIERHGVTHVHFVPSVFNTFLGYVEKNAGCAARLSSLRHIFLSGEALAGASVDRFYRLFPDTIELHNLYGPTECAVDVTYHDCRAGERTVPIGRPIDNTVIFITDDSLRPVPRGTKGEICIGGMNVGAGYVNDPSLTRQVFCRMEDTGEKVYRTGDIGYIDENGEVVFCSRKDGQLKINGQRVETGEAENTVASFPGVTDCVVVPREKNGKTVLAAFYCGTKHSPALLKSHCAESLPAYMIPSFFIHLAEIPTGKNGKADRKTLSCVELNDRGGEPIPPVTETEKAVCAAFAEILKTEKAGLDTDFIAEGGSSLDIITFVSDERFRSVSVGEFVASPTPGAIAKLLERKKLPDFRRLIQVKEINGSDKAVIIFPFAGGTAASFTKLIDIAGRQTGANVFFADFARDGQALAELAEEVVKLSGAYAVTFYCHCVGAYPALRTARVQSERNRPVKGICCAGFIPPRKKKPLPWKHVPDGLLEKILSAAGAGLPALPPRERKTVLENFRRDTDAVSDVYGPVEKQSVPVRVLLSDGDPFTPRVSRAEKRFGELSDNAVSVEIFRGKNHYFQNDRAERIAAILNGFYSE